jgi:hypothetical protein
MSLVEITCKYTCTQAVRSSVSQLNGFNIVMKLEERENRAKELLAISGLILCNIFYDHWVEKETLRKL